MKRVFRVTVLAGGSGPFGPSVEDEWSSGATTIETILTGSAHGTPLRATVARAAIPRLLVVEPLWCRHKTNAKLHILSTRVSCSPGLQSGMHEGPGVYDERRRVDG